MGPPEDGQEPARSQSVSRPAAGHPRMRRCLLKGCETAFRPATALERYCSDACRESAREWSVWRADQKYRATEQGKQHRQEQSKRYRKRVGQRSGPRLSTPGEADEGDRREGIPGTPCDRPGCYDLFGSTSRSPLQRFCSRPCRMAWRRAIQRERRWKGPDQPLSSDPSLVRPGGQSDVSPLAPSCSPHIAPSIPPP